MRAKGEPSQAYCKRCSELFVYFKTNRARLYCAPCGDLEREDLNRFTRLQRRKDAATRALQERSTKNLYRFRGHSLVEGAVA